MQAGIFLCMYERSTAAKQCGICAQLSGIGNRIEALVVRLESHGYDFSIIGLEIDRVLFAAPEFDPTIRSL